MSQVMIDKSKAEGLYYELIWFKENEDEYIEFVRKMKKLKTIGEDWLEARRRLITGQSTKEDFLKYGGKTKIKAE